jgi:uncharacterized protein YbbK (DUF523 family)
VFLVSACLLGRRSRYDGGHKLLPGLSAELARVGAVVLPVCPEADAGLPVPRPPMDLHSAADGTPRLLTADGRDLAPLLARWIDSALPLLLSRPPAAAILKTKSPSCGTAPDGLFAAALRRALPELPLWTEHDALARLADFPDAPEPT